MARPCLRGEQRGERGEHLLLELPHQMRLANRVGTRQRGRWVVGIGRCATRVGWVLGIGGEQLV